MTKQVINVGATANDKKGDSLRAAFQKVNANFTELYTVLGINADVNLNIGAFEFTGSVMSTTDSTPIVIDQAATVTSDLTVGGDILPQTANGGDLGSLAKPFRSLYVSNNTIYLGSTPLSVDESGNILIDGNVYGGVGNPFNQSLNTDDDVTFDSLGATTVNVSQINGTNPGNELVIQANNHNWTFGTNGALTFPDGLTIDNSVIGYATSDTISEEIPGGTISSTSIVENQIAIDSTNSITISKVTTQINNDGVTTSTDSTGSTLEINNTGASIKRYIDPDGPNNSMYFQVRTDNTGAVLEGVEENIGYTDYGRVTAVQGVVEVSTGTDNTNNVWTFDTNGDLTLPVGGDILDSNGDSVLGGAAGPVQPYLELTDTPIVIQPAVLGTPVTVTVPPSGINAELIVEIGEGPVINAIVIMSPGTGYVVGQRYRIWNYQIGGGGDSNSIDFEVATVGQAGELLTITGAAFTGPTPNNPQQTYTNVSPNYQPQPVLDEIDTGLTLTRDQNQGIYNIELEQDYDRDNYLSPLGTEWNSDGWGDLLGLETRTYTTWRQALNNAVGNNIVASELVMHDIANDKYYKFDFTNWGGSNGNYSYTRTLIGEDRNYFRKDDYATANNVDVIEDDSTLQIGITRGNNNGIYNPFTEEDWDQNVSPQGTLWNIDGWDDLTDVETRTYTNFYAAYGNGQLGNRVPGSKAVMYVPSIEKYYAIEWLGWTENNQGGGFSYNRYEIDLTKLNEGITFANGTVQKTAYVDTNVVSTAPGERRIETASGYKQVAVTERVTSNYTGAVSQTTNGYELRIARTPELDAVIIPLNDGDLDVLYTLSFDNVNFREVWLSSIQQNEYWFYYQNDNNQTTPQTQGDPVYLRIVTGADSQIWWNKSELPSGSNDFRGAVIDYHAYTGEATIIGTIHIVDDDGEEHITHTEVSSGSDDSMNDNLWIVTSEGSIRYARFDGEAKTLKIHWTAKVFYGSELYD